MKRNKKIWLVFIAIILILLIIFFIPESRKEIRTQHFTFRFSSSIDTSKILALSRTLEYSYMRIGEDLQTKPSDKIETNIYASRWRYIKATKNWSASGNIEGISKLHFLEQDSVETHNVAVHEFAHTVTLKLLVDKETETTTSEEFDKKFTTFPVWLWEAISVYEAGQFVEPKTLSYLSNGQYPSLSELNLRIKGGKIYKCGYTIIEYILSKYGKDKFISLIKNYGNVQNVFGVSEEQFSKDWYTYLKEKYLR